MAARSKDPAEKVRELQRSLGVCAKRSRTRRFHALYAHLHRSDVLWEAWKRVKKNRGAAGVDKQTLAAIEKEGSGEQRPLGIPTVRDRVAQMAAKIVVEPIFEADFLPCSYGFRPKRNATQALEAVRETGNRGHNFVVDADIRAYYDTIDQEKLLGMVEGRISDQRMLKLLRKWLEAGVMEDGTVRETLAGTSQGGVVSPLPANIYLHRLDDYRTRECKHLGVPVRYADDMVAMCQTRAQSSLTRGVRGERPLMGVAP